MNTRHESMTGAYGCPMGTIPTEFLPLSTIIDDETRVNIPMEEPTLPLVDSVHKVTSYRCAFIVSNKLKVPGRTLII